MSHERPSIPRKRYVFGLMFLLSVLVIMALARVRSSGGRRLSVGVHGLLQERKFHTNDHGEAFPEYAAAVSVLQENGWSKKRFEQYLAAGAELPSTAELSVLSEAMSHVIEGASRQRAGNPRLDDFQTTVRFKSDDLELTDFTLPARAAVLVARSHFRRNDHEGAISALQTALAMGSHLVASDHVLLAMGGLHNCKIAIDELLRIAQQTGNVKTEDAYRSALVALDADFRDLRERANEGPSILDIFDLLKK